MSREFAIQARSAHQALVLSSLLAWGAALAPMTPVWAAYPKAVNATAIDAVINAAVKPTSTAPMSTFGSIYQAAAQNLSNALNSGVWNQQQSMVTAQAATTMGIATLYSIDTASSGLATKAILGTAAGAVQPLQALTALPAEGVLGGVGLLMFNTDGLAAPYADYYVVADEGYDYYTDQDQNLIMFAHQVRTFGNAPSAATDVGFVLPQASVLQFYPQLLAGQASLSPALGSTTMAAATEPLSDIYFGVKYADGSKTYYQASLQLPAAAVPEPAGWVLALAGLAVGVIGRRRMFSRRRPSAC